MPRTIPRLSLLAAAAILLVAACTGASGLQVLRRPAEARQAARRPLRAPCSAGKPAPPAPTNTVWLCRPGMADDPCAGDLTATAIKANGSTSVEPAAPANDPPIDCFYVYPTVSLQKGTNANLEIDPQERAIAVAEAAQFSQVCNVYAPMYPQLTAGRDRQARRAST